MTTPAHARRTPMVIVARRVLPGKERAFRRWLERLVHEASTAPGYVAADVQEPGTLHPDEWVVVYRFDDAGHLSDWLSSPARATLLREGRDLVAGDAREQVVALSDEPEPVTAVSSARVPPENAQAYRQLHLQAVERLQTFDGFLHSDLYEPVEGVQDDTVVVFAFDSRPHLDAWLRSDVRRELIEPMDALVEGARTVNVVGGFAGWFGPEGEGGVKRWKQAAVVLLALFPTSVGLTVLRGALLPDLPLLPAVFVTNVVGVAILTWLLMPVLTRLLHGWLRR